MQYKTQKVLFPGKYFTYNPKVKLPENIKYPTKLKSILFTWRNEKIILV